MESPLRNEVTIDPRLAYFNSAGVGLLTHRARQAVEAHLERVSREGTAADKFFFEQTTGARATIARLIGAKPEQVAFFQTCAAAISQVALGLPLNKDSEILLWDAEYPSNAYPWHEAGRRSGARVTVLKSGEDRATPTERMLQAIGPKTKVVAVSWIQYQTGAEADLAALSEACHKYGAWLAVDAIQGLGVLPFNMAALGVDAVCSGSHKWLCGPIGVGFLALAPQHIESLEPLLHGARTYGMFYDPIIPDKKPAPEIGRYEPGSHNLMGEVALGASAEVLLEKGIDVIGAQARGLSSHLREGLRHFPKVKILDNVSSHRSPIVTFVPDRDPKEVRVELVKRGIIVANPPAGIRVSPHAFNTLDEIDHLLAALKEILS